MRKNVLHFQKMKVVEGRRERSQETKDWGQRIIFAVSIVFSKLKNKGASLVQV